MAIAVADAGPPRTNESYTGSGARRGARGRSVMSRFYCRRGVALWVSMLVSVTAGLGAAPANMAPTPPLQVTSAATGPKGGAVALAPGSRAHVEVQAVAFEPEHAAIRAPARVAFRDGAVSRVGAPIPGRVVELHVEVGTGYGSNRRPAGDDRQPGVPRGSTWMSRARIEVRAHAASSRGRRRWSPGGSAASTRAGAGGAPAGGVAGDAAARAEGRWRCWAQQRRDGGGGGGDRRDGAAALRDAGGAGAAGR